MGDDEVRLFRSWTQQLAETDSPLDFLYEHIWAPDIDHHAAEGAPDDVGPIIGRDAMRAYVADWYEMFADLTFVPQEIVDGGFERVIVVWRVTGTAKASGVPTELRYAAVYTIRGDRIVRGREYMTKDEALAAIGSEGKTNERTG
jgi:ketosteroid isomerase-like protein